MPLNTSVILVVAVALWLIWVAPYVLRRGRPLLAAPAQVVHMTAATSGQSGDAHTHQAASHMSSSAPLRPSPEQVEPPMPQSTSTPAPFRVHYGRTAVALLGVVALLTLLVGGVLALVGVVSAAVPLVAVLVSAGCVVLLRALAIRARRKKVDAAFREAMGSEAAAEAARFPVAGSRDDERSAHGLDVAVPVSGAVPISGAVPVSGAVTVSPDAVVAGPRQDQPQQTSAWVEDVFDAEAADDAAAATVVAVGRPFNAAELRSAALAVAAQGRAAAAAAHDEPEAEPWQPVDLPAPAYVDAPKAGRLAPQPLELPESPKPAARTSIKASEAAGKANEAAGTTPRNTTALGNLDDVLQRRRA
jgi:hypothetical protein